MTDCCGACNQLDRPDVVAFLTGKSHVRPDDLAYTDNCRGRERYAGIRRNAWKELQQADPFAAMDWPEFQGIAVMQEHYRHDLAVIFSSRFGELLKHAPGFWHHLEQNPFTFRSRKNTRRQRLKEIGREEKIWKRQVILNFIGMYGSDRMRMLCKLTGKPVPWWDVTVKKVPVSQAA